MDRIRKYLTASAIAVVSVVGGSAAQDRRDVIPEMKVLLENDCVRVQYHDVAVGPANEQERSW